MNAYIEYALIDVEAEDLATVAGVAMDAKDRHVLAAAVSPDKLLAARRQTVRLSRRSEADILATLEPIVGEPVADTIRALAADHG
jgi:hypothetical protein